MITKDFWVLLAMVIYFVAMLTIGFIYSKRSNSSTRQYFAETMLRFVRNPI